MKNINDQGFVNAVRSLRSDERFVTIVDFLYDYLGDLDTDLRRASDKDLYRTQGAALTIEALLKTIQDATNRHAD